MEGELTSRVLLTFLYKKSRQSSLIIPTAICVDSTEEGIQLASALGDLVVDGSPDVADSDGEDSEMDKNLEIFNLERLDFDDENGDNKVVN
jgi:hypothetical protein